MKKHLLILSIFLALALMLAGCATGGVKKERILVPVTDKIFMEEHGQNVRSYHLKVSKGAILDAFAVKIFALNGVQDVKTLAYQIIVMTSPLFKWKDIQPEVLKILKQ